ncbi:unnamed protein product [Bursaphelenchus xylophilus]|uniref:(pine wood nematode) hypothetical protein n=1 Tax=Bursaphelenchus xylophilus TaxID=6326 RepID=A0A1I7RU46_BURXY|nr:unnamed protein product [Bursaphelenchus xylophilus]CAG9113812.1 unnamed protein product [Bursaphelenchus xylophilus]
MEANHNLNHVNQPQPPGISEATRQFEVAKAYYGNEATIMKSLIQSGHIHVKDDGQVLQWNPMEQCYDRDYRYRMTKEKSLPSWIITPQAAHEVAKNVRGAQFLSSNYYRKTLISDKLKSRGENEQTIMQDDGRREHHFPEVLDHPFLKIPEEHIHECLQDIFVRQNYKSV